MARAFVTRSFHIFQRSNIAETYPHLADMPGFEEPGIPEAWLCAAADGNMAQVKAAFDAQHFDLDGFVPQSLEEVAAAAPKAKKVPAEKAKKSAAKKAAKASAAEQVRAQEARAPQEDRHRVQAAPQKAKATKPKKTMAPSAQTPTAWSGSRSSHLRRRRRSGRNGTPGPAADDIDTDAYFVSPSSLPA